MVEFIPFILVSILFFCSAISILFTKNPGNIPNHEDDVSGDIY